MTPEDRKRLLSVFTSMLDRCRNERCKSYKYYGGRGISVCDEWSEPKKGSCRFFLWAEQNGYKRGLSLDRINNYGNYEPTNCRWATIKEQSLNKRPRIVIKQIEGKTNSTSKSYQVSARVPLELYNKIKLLASKRAGKITEAVVFLLNKELKK